MAVITVVRPPTEPRTQPPPPPGRQPKARLAAGGTVLELPFAPQGGDLGGWADEWETLGRPGRKPLVQRNGDGVKTLGHTYVIAHRDYTDHVEGLLDTLRKLAESGDRVTLVNLSPLERGPWRIVDVSVSAELRQPGSNRISRATVSVSYLEAVDADPKLGPVHGGKKKHKGHKGISKARHYTIKKGDTCRKLAARFYGEPGEWRRIAKRNHIKTPNHPQVGRKIVIPPDDKD